MNTLHQIYTTLCGTRARPFRSRFISVLLNFLKITDTSGRYPNTIKAASLQLDPLQWLQGRQGSETGQRSSCSKKPHLFSVITTVWFRGTDDFTCCQFFFHLSGHENAAPAASWLNGSGGVLYTPSCAAYGTKNIKEEVNLKIDPADQVLSCHVALYRF